MYKQFICSTNHLDDISRMEKAPGALIRIPLPEALESPSSWLSRVALSQAVEFRDLLGYFDISRSTDIDSIFVTNEYKKIVDKCQLNINDFRPARYFYKNLNSLNLNFFRFLVRDYHHEAHQYCPVCLHFQREKHFLLHWRLKILRSCDLHKCMLDEGCRNCGRRVGLPMNMAESNSRRVPIIALDRCAKCGWRLSSHWKQARNTINTDTTTRHERKMLKRGHAVLALLYRKNLFSMRTTNPKYEALRVALSKHLKFDAFLLNASEVEKRVEYLAQLKPNTKCVLLLDASRSLIEST